jgi:hypothetical protein
MSDPVGTGRHDPRPPRRATRRNPGHPGATLTATMPHERTTHDARAAGERSRLLIREFGSVCQETLAILAESRRLLRRAAEADVTLAADRHFPRSPG